MTGTAALLWRRSSQDAVVAAAQADSHAGIAALTFLIWDAAIHFDDEVEYIWKGPNNWMKFMYIFIRWMPILGESSLVTIITSEINFSPRACMRWLAYEAAVVEAVTLSVEIVLMVRVYALYNHNKAILWTITILFVVEVTVMITALAFSVPRMSFNPQCLITDAPFIFVAFWIASLTFETILFGLTLVQFFKFMYTSRVGGSSILHTFVRDGTWAFAIIFVIELLNLLMYQLIDSPLAGICYFWAVSTMSFAGSHVLLNLRRLGPRGNGTSMRTSNSIFTTNLDMCMTHDESRIANYDDLFPDEDSARYESISNANMVNPVIPLTEL